MTDKDNQQITLPVFPLGDLVLPGELKELHIFEERYKEMMRDCLGNNASFGIVLGDKKKKGVSDFGVLVKVVRVFKTYPSGEMDILVEGKEIFKTLKYVSVLMPKLYGAATVELMKSEDFICSSQTVALYRQLLEIIDSQPAFEPDQLTVFALAKALNLDKKEKLELISEFTKKRMEERIMDKIKMSIHICKSEKKLNGDFWLN